MLKIILQDPNYLRPFNERARDLRIQNKPLWLAQRDVLAPYTNREIELPYGATLPKTQEESLVYRDMPCRFPPPTPSKATFTWLTCGTIQKVQESTVSRS
jgi:hypothetical protein